MHSFSSSVFRYEVITIYNDSYITKDNIYWMIIKKIYWIMY